MGRGAFFAVLKFMIALPDGSLVFTARMPYLCTIKSAAAGAYNFRATPHNCQTSKNMI